MHDNEQNHPSRFSIFIGMVLFGSIWGLFESTVGGLLRLSGLGLYFKTQLHMCPCPLLVFAFGSPIMAAALAIYRKPAMLPGIGLVAASFSFLVIPIHNVPFLKTPYTTYPIINPAIAIVLSSVFFYLIICLVKRKLAMNTYSLAVTGMLSAMITSIAFIYIVVYLGAPILKAIGLDSPLIYIATNGVIFTVISASTSPLGYVVGLKTDQHLSPLVKRRSWLSPTISFTTIVICMLGSFTSIWVCL